MDDPPKRKRGRPKKRNGDGGDGPGESSARDPKKTTERERERVRVGHRPSSRHRRFYSLPCFNELYAKLTSGEKLGEIARWLQEDMCECTDVTRGSLLTMLSRFKNDLPAKDHPSVTGDERALHEDLVAVSEVMRSQIDELEELGRLYEMQMGRIRLFVSREVQSPMPWSALNKEISLAASILSKRHEVKMDLGIGGGRNLGTIGIRPEVDARIAAYGEGVRKALASQESRSRILSIVESIVRVKAAAGSEKLEEILDVETMAGDGKPVIDSSLVDERKARDGGLGHDEDR